MGRYRPAGSSVRDGPPGPMLATSSLRIRFVVRRIAGSGTGVPGVRCSDERRPVACAPANSLPRRHGHRHLRGPPRLTAFPQFQWRKIWSTNSLERINGEIEQRRNVVGIFPNDASVARLVAAVIVEAHDEWAVADGVTCPTSPQPRSTAPTETGRPLGSHHGLSRTVTRADDQAGRRLRPPRGIRLDRRRVLRGLRAAMHASAPLPFGACHANLVSRDHLVP